MSISNFKTMIFTEKMPAYQQTGFYGRNRL